MEETPIELCGALQNVTRGRDLDSGKGAKGSETEDGKSTKMECT